MPKELIPKGLRPRMLVLVIVCVILPTLVMAGHELSERREAMRRTAAEAALLSRFTVERADHLFDALPANGVSRARLLGVVADAAREAAAFVGADGGGVLPGRVSFVVVDRAGRLVSRPLDPGPWRDSLVAPFPARAGWEQEMRGADGRRRIVGFAALPHGDGAALWIGAGVDVDQALEAQWNDLWRTLSSLALLGVFALLVAWWAVSADVLRRVDALATAIELRRDEQARAAQELRMSEARKSAVLEASLDGILLLDEQGNVIECNASARRMFGCEGRHCMRHTLAELFPEVLPFDSKQFSRPSEVHETVCRRHDRTLCPVEISIAPIRDPAATGLFAATVRDITERKIWEHSLATLSYMDELTGLYNRRGFHMFAEQQLRLASRGDASVVLVGVDLDGLKQINDTYGHANGDRALVELADALRSSFRDADVIGRIGGDEFAILATESHGEGADQALERFVRRISGRNAQGDLPWSLSASVGWARTIPHEGQDLGALLESVDARMYEQKRMRSRSSLIPRDALARAA